MATLFESGSPVSFKILLFALVVAVVAGVGLATSGSPTAFFGIDLTAPAVSISFSPNIAVGQDHLIIASATDVSGISQVEIYIDNALKKTCTNSPCTYSAAYNTPGEHSVYATARDGSPSRNQKISAAQTFVVSEPEVTMLLGTGVITATEIELFWSEHPKHGSTPGNYYIVFGNNAPLIYSTKTSANLFGLSPGKTYSIYVAAVEKDTGAIVGKSDSVTVTTLSG